MENLFLAIQLIDKILNTLKRFNEKKFKQFYCAILNLKDYAISEIGNEHSKLNSNLRFKNLSALNSACFDLAIIISKLAINNQGFMIELEKFLISWKSFNE